SLGPVISTVPVSVAVMVLPPILRRTLPALKARSAVGSWHLLDPVAALCNGNDPDWRRDSCGTEERLLSPIGRFVAGNHGAGPSGPTRRGDVARDQSSSRRRTTRTQ